MTRRQNNPDLHELARLLEGESDTSTGAEVDADVVGAYLHGTLSPSEHAAFEELLSERPDLRELVALLVAEPADAQLPEKAPSRRWTWAAAAALLIAVLTPLVWKQVRNTPTQALPTRLANAAVDLRSSFPSLDDLQLLTTEEIQGTSTPRERSGNQLVALLPRGRELSTRPTLIWFDRQEHARYDVTLMTNDGQMLFERSVTGSALPWPDVPPLESGRRYLWVLRPAGDGSAEITVDFEVVSGEDARSWSTDRAAVLKRSPEDLADLLLAHLAVRRGYVREALRHTEAFVQEHPTEAVGLEFRRAVTRSLGLLDELDDGTLAALRRGLKEP